MRKAVLVLAACAVLATSSPAWAQSGAGVMLGINWATLHFSGTDVIQPDKRTGLAVGLFFTAPVAKSAGIEMDVLYSQKGAKITEGGGSMTIEVDYLDVPVLARMTAGAGPTKLAFVVGPSFGFKLRAHAKEEFGGQSQDTDIGPDVSSFDFGLVIGAGIDAGKFLLDGRYQWGLSNANKTEFATTDTVKHRVLSILFGIRL